MRIDKEALAEVDVIIEMMSEENAAKIPNAVKSFVKAKKSAEYVPKIRTDVPLYRQTLKEDTRTICSLLYRNYLCTEEERKRLEKKDEEVFAQEAKKYEFSNSVDKSILKSEVQAESIKSSKMNGLVKYNEGRWQKIKKLFNCFKRN